jgi:hypothetical protein
MTCHLAEAAVQQNRESHKCCAQRQTKFQTTAPKPCLTFTPIQPGIFPYGLIGWTPGQTIVAANQPVEQIGYQTFP